MFAEANGRITHDLKAMLAAHSATGSLRAGVTIIRAAEIVDKRGSEALAQLCAEAANRIDHRGRAWSQAMLGISDALLASFDGWRELTQPTVRIAAGDSEGAAKAGDNLLSEAFVRMREQLVAFRDGWTAPRSRPWRERNALLYALLLVALGAIVGEGVKTLLPKVAGRLFNVPSAPSTATAPGPARS